ncbi:myo-inositol 2-dehydrogenase/D-chiro-inositol 1-dehydrogenase [Arcanobacterium pluranimalium]|uniref:inositol 2-dehydrogenase n=1 Tax=Arcanobacterium pluranimalium TaxID=108028 RepID=UPI00195DECF3|nr:inositol 2-dehydrogenase [Arcanobacterium pluranimalium]MBM7824678.1 myo-inositol 2-dehydrogenase/D-chiro-inositol 1-dehydrogenase [Arcanobacterium pluranimalium]
MVNIGIIGAGRIAHVHAKAVAAHTNAKLVMVADPYADSAAQLAGEYGLAWSTEPQDVFASSDVDAVIICSPTPFHVDHILAAHKAGKPALCEKPIAMDMAEVERLKAELAEEKPMVMMGFNRRFDPSFNKMHRMVEDGIVGDLEQVTIISRDPAAPPREYIAQSGGIFKDMTIHDFDTARYFLGDVTSVFAVGQHLDPNLADTGDYDGVVIVLTNSAGKTATITNSRHCASGYDQRLEVFGNKATLNAENIRPTTVRVSNGTTTDAQDPYLDFFLTRYTEAYAEELDAFLQAINTATLPSPSIDDAVEALKIAEAAAESARTGQQVRL